jgi:hypothetical protein
MHGADMRVRKTCVILALPVARSFMKLDDQLLQGLDRARHRVDRGTMMALTMLVPVLAFVRKWRARRELPTAA